ncbi:TATA element modulatory factor 1 [Physocladia obscura]|uniref:TATA element modulatory factor 1 n=1 Tax=Physocladia obscura TaxID=109957 RepID=A0AAD5T6C7_9FUNG|nr:TATA element modulatory factor 1 [Physocladia obscura]
MDGWFSNITTSLAHVVSEASAHLDQALLDSNSNSTSAEPASLTPELTVVSASGLLTPKMEALTLQKNLTLDSLNSFSASTGDFFSGIISSTSTSSHLLNLANQQLINNDQSNSAENDKNASAPPPSLGPPQSPSHLELRLVLLSDTSPSSVPSAREHPPEASLKSPIAKYPTTQILSNAIDVNLPTEIIESTRKGSESTNLQSKEAPTPIPLANIAEHVNPSTQLTEEQRLISIISQREQQILSALLANTLLSDDIADLKKQIDALPAAAPNNSTSSHDSTSSHAAFEEFARRLDVSEKLSNSAIKDRDKYNANLASLQSSFDETLRQLSEREEKIKILLEEGEKLSKNELKMSTITKKLRAKEAESESLIKDQSKKIENLTLELSDLKEKLSRLIESEKKLGESLGSSLDVSERQAKQIAKLENELTAAKGEASSFKALLERARADLQEFRKLEADTKSVAHAEALEAEILANETLHKQMLDQRKQFTNVQAALQKQVFDFQSALARVEDEANWKEDNFRKEIGQLQSQLQAAEERHEDLFAEARTADRPLVRQIESLQVQHTAARKDWQHIEINLTTRLQQAEREILKYTEREKFNSQRYEDLNLQFQMLEFQFSRERQERSRIQAELEEKAAKLDNSDRSVSDLTAKLTVLKNSHTRVLEDAESKFQHMFQEERDRIVRERAEVDDLRLLSEKTNIIVGVPATTTIPSSLGIGVNGTSSAGYGPMRVNSFSSADGIVSPSGYETDSNRGGSFEFGVSSVHVQQNMVVERLYRNLKQLQGQVSSLQTQLQMVTCTRDELAEELLKATLEVTEAKTSASKINSLSLQLGDLNQRYMAALELLGEKTEQVEDLQINISELKKIQKEEIEELMKLKK